ncbi:MAG: hypothetical protein K8R36_14390 [Planctomycetales bacterium]|nr:hypothetical protein [Planctomycetales bacterium]
MAKSQLPSLAIFLSFVVATVARGGDDPHSLEKIAASLAELQDQPPVVHYKIEKTVFWPKGSMNWELEFDELNRRRKLAEEKEAKNLPYQGEDLDQGVDVPSEDVTLTTTEESVRDLAQGMSWSKGAREACELVRDAHDLPRLRHWIEPFEEAFDGVDSYARIDPGSPRVKNSSHRIPIGFEIWRITAEKGETSPSPEWLPRIFCEGGLPRPKQPEARVRNEWPFLPDRWTRGAEENDPEGHPVIYTLPWFAGVHYQCSLRPDLHYVPCKWQSYYQDQLKAELEIEYEPAEGGMPVLRSWKYRSFNEGKLQAMKTFRVVSMQRESSVDPALFRLKPHDGLIVMEIKTESDSCYIAGRQTIKSTSIMPLNDKLQLYEARFQWFNCILAGCSLLVGTVVVLGWRRFGRRKSAPQPLGQELPT